MKAAVVTKFSEPLEIQEIPVPDVPDDRIRVKIEATGVCHTDLHAAHGDWPVKPTLPFVPGHEGVGVVEAVGSRVTDVIREGDRVGVPWLHTACGYCRQCMAGWETLCPSQQNTGYSVNGSFAEYAIADPKFVGHLPEGLGFVEAAPVLCAGVTVYKGLKELDCEPGEWVVVSGVGGLGHLGVQYAKAMGHRVIGVDVADSKIELAKTLGAEAAVNAMNDDPVAFVQEITGGGAQGVLVTAVSPKAFDQAVGMLGRRGTMSLVGLPPGEFGLPIFDVVLSRKTVRGSIVGTRLDLAEALDFAARGLVKVSYTTDRLENINDIFDRMEKGAIDGRVVMELV
jgi:propanol-preferring alcohol dehydrogenase